MRIAIIGAAAYVSGSVADDVLKPSGAYPAVCRRPSEFWSLFEQCRALGGEHLFQVALVVGIVAGIATFITRPLTRGGVASKLIVARLAARVRDNALLLLLLGSVLVGSSLFGLGPSRRIAAYLLLTGSLLIAIGAPGLVPKRVRATASLLSVSIVFFLLVLFSALFSKRWVD